MIDSLKRATSLSDRSSLDFLLRQVSLVLVVDSQFLQASELLVLDAFNLDTLVLEFLSDFAALLEVVQSDLLLDLVVLSNLVPKSVK